MSGFARRLQQAVVRTSGKGGGTAVEPTLSSTGPRITPTTTINGDYTLAANESIAGYHITGDLYFNGANSSAADCQVDGTIAVNQRPGGNYNVPEVGGQKAAYCTATGLSSVGTGGIELDHCQIGRTTGSPGTIMTWQMLAGTNLAHNVNMHDCYVFGTPSVGAGSGFHLELIHNEGLTDSVFTNNHLEYFCPDAATDGETTAALNCSSDFGPPSDNIYDGNWIYGGGSDFTAYFYMGSGVVIKNNRFHSYSPYPGQPTHTPNVYSKSNFTAGGTNMSSWVDPTVSTVFGNTIDGVAWDLAGALLA